MGIRVHQQHLAARQRALRREPFGQRELGVARAFADDGDDHDFTMRPAANGGKKRKGESGTVSVMVAIASELDWIHDSSARRTAA
ncbi:hypothetical protein GCM10007386_03980 [Pseudoduganella dura]|nr:hypothetical protein GCM10007386_03980 [Pseudoduganella dura]